MVMTYLSVVVALFAITNMNKENYVTHKTNREENRSAKGTPLHILSKSLYEGNNNSYERKTIVSMAADGQYKREVQLKQPGVTNIREYNETNSRTHTRLVSQSDRKNFQFYINEEDMCKRTPYKALKLLVVVYVAVKQATERDVIRKGWGKEARENLNCRLIFLLGKPRDGDTTELEAESIKHQDIVAEDYTDTYRNLTLKSFAMFQWVAQYCQHAQYVLKIDSDVEINVPKLLTTLDTRTIPDKFNCGRLMKKSKVFRQKYHKWFVSKDNYPNDYFPPYCLGVAFIMPNRLIIRLSTIPIPFRHPFPVDDAYTTGILREEINEGIDTGLFRFRNEKSRDERLHGRRMIHVVFRAL